MGETIFKFKKMKNVLRIPAIILLLSLLFLVRAYEKDLFYDPLIVYFQNDYLYQSMPSLDSWRLVLNMLLRYLLNSIVSLVIIYLIFKKRTYIKFAGFFYMLAFIVLIVFFGVLLRNQFDSGYLLPFYIRRFIIHPLFLFLLLPAFYYQKKYRK